MLKLIKMNKADNYVMWRSKLWLWLLPRDKYLYNLQFSQGVAWRVNFSKTKNFSNLSNFDIQEKIEQKNEHVWYGMYNLIKHLQGDITEGRELPLATFWHRKNVKKKHVPLPRFLPALPPKNVKNNFIKRKKSFNGGTSEYTTRKLYHVL